MLIIENIKLAFRSLMANKMRAFLTMLGIIIGIGSVITIMTVSSSLTSSISVSFQEMGANNVTVGLKQRSEESETRSNGMKFGVSGRSVNIDEADLITDEMLDSLKSTFSQEIDAISISESIGSGSFLSEGSSSNISVTGINADYFVSNDITLLAGRYLTETDLSGQKKVVMISDKVVESLFNSDNESALWQPIQMNLDGCFSTYYVVGVYEYDDSLSFSSASDSDVTTTAYIPLTTGKEQIHGNDGYSQFTIVSSTSVQSVSEFAEEIESFFSPYYLANENYSVATTTMESMTESMNEMIQTVSLAISFIAGISLLVGGIGVMNIMLVSITERTREIGTRKALGAKNSSIRLQFIVEAVILCLVGGILGILTGLLLGSIAAAMLGYSATAPVAAIFAATGFSMVIGVFFGYYPANKAAKLNPIDALRYE